MPTLKESRRDIYNYLASIGVDIKIHHKPIKALLKQNSDAKAVLLEKKIKKLGKTIYELQTKRGVKIAAEPPKTSFSMPKNVKELYKI